ncbi:MAG: glycoside hydrolase family 127 protein [Bryobacteraceae bacterium]|nr:glycoside hydrolase family 127 protein [Bryobacteraceae bacterium]
MNFFRCHWSRAFARPLFLAPALVVLAHGAADSPALVKLTPVPFTDVEINDVFWAPRRETNRIASIPVNLANLEKAKNLQNLRLAARRATAGFEGPVFMDSDVYKALEAASYSLAMHPDPALEKALDDIIAVLAAAQHPDGYLNSYYTVKEPGKRWVNLRDNHELYCAGHLIEAAVAHFQATGKRNLLNVATKFADHIDSVFGPPPKRMGYPGHPEIELALVKLWRVTGERRYFELARFFVESRGQKFFATEHQTPLERYDGSYWQDDVPIYDHQNIKGHAVRACYLFSGVTDVARETGDVKLLKMLNRVWRNTTERNLYLTGGIGPSAHNEGFTVDYDLPNLTAYQETCATIALAQWNHRLALLYGDAKYADIVERALYNGVLAGVSRNGERFFYVNPLESRGNHHRSEWFGCACCPPNVARTLASLGGYAYATSADALYVNLYIQGAVKATVAGESLKLHVTTEYPWSGVVILKPEPAKPTSLELRLRVPEWCRGEKLSVNGKTVASPVKDHGYLVVRREWRKGDSVRLELPMPVERIVAHPNVRANHGLLALQRGPLVYCLEQCDQEVPLEALYLLPDDRLTADREAGLLGGVVTVRGFANVAPELAWDRRLYQALPPPRVVPFKAIPYYAWDNRKPGAMKVWLPTSAPVPRIGGLEAQAKVSVSFASNNAQPSGINDGAEPASSGQQPAALCHWWPHKGSEEWAQYTWTKPVRLAGVRVYWFDDIGRGECRLPAGWSVAYREGDAWHPVKATGAFTVAADRWCEVRFEPVTTAALRLQVKLQPGWSAGVHEWKVIEAEEE